VSFFAELKRRNVVRVGIAYVLMGWLLLQAADFGLDLIDAPNWIIQAFALLVALGLPVALFLAWAFELTPEGVKRESEVDRTTSITHETGRKLDRAIIGILAIAVMVLLADRFIGTGERPSAGDRPAADPTTEVAVTAIGEPAAPAELPQANTKSIAVLPFADLSQSQDQQWFADGLAEEILNALVKVPDLAVTARTSSFQYRGSTLSIEQIAAELGVAHILEGSIRSGGDRIRVTAQLIRASDGVHLWSESYDRQNTDMIGIQEDLARNIASVLETSMDPQALEQMARVGTRSVEAYQAYLRGVQALADSFAYSTGGAKFRESYELFEKALEYDPQFAEAHVRVAEYWKVEVTPTRTDTGTSGLSYQQALDKFYTHIQLAIDNAKTDSDRIRSLANRAVVDVRLGEARQLFEQYLETWPNDEAVQLELVSILQTMSLHEEARAYFERWREKGQTEQYSAGVFMNGAYRSMDPSEAADFGLEAMKRWPASSTLAYQTHRTLLWAGRNKEASEVAARYKTLVPGNAYLVDGREACAAGDRKKAEEILAQIEENDPEAYSRLWLMQNMLGNTGMEAEVLRPLEASGIAFQLVDFMGYPQFDPRPFPSLMAMIEREGIQRPDPVAPPFQCPPAGS